MNHKILKQSKNPFLHREEYLVSITSDKNPSFLEVKQIIGKHEDLTIVKSLKGNFGRNTFNAEAVVYDSLESKNKIEKISRKQRKKLVEEAKKTEGGNQGSS